MIKRTRSLEETISIVTSLSKEIGLTRLVDITGLDISVFLYMRVCVRMRNYYNQTAEKDLHTNMHNALL